MLRPRLIVVTGPTGSGKTTLAAKLATQLHLPLVCRDLLKSGMTRHDGRAAFDAFYAILGAHLDRGISIVADQALHREYGPAELAPFLTIASTFVVECRANSAVCRDRIAARVEARERHESHPDEANLVAMDAGTYSWKDWMDLPVEAARLLVDTTDGYRPDLDGIARFVTA